MKNKKAQFEIVALAFLVAGVTTVAAAALLSVGTGVQARAQFVQNFISVDNELSEIETFYSDLINLAARNALASRGYDLGNFCALGVKPDDALKNSIIDESEKLISKHVSYGDVNLPYMRTNSSIGEIHFFSANVSVAKGGGITYSSQSTVTYDFPKEYYADEIKVTIKKGGSSASGDIAIKAFSAADSTNPSCKYTFSNVSAQGIKTANFICNNKVKKVSATASGSEPYVDNFVLTAYIPSLSYLEITGFPAEKILLKTEDISISSPGSFATRIPSTIKESKPNLVISGVVLSNNPVTEGSTVQVTATIRNIGCANTSDPNNYIQIWNSTTEIHKTSAFKLDRGSELKVSANFVPLSAGTYDIIAKGYSDGAALTPKTAILTVNKKP